MADLEQRVQALEQELQILKNQIQTILLDIQEQVLSNTYPGLRAGDNHQPAAILPSRPRPDTEESPRPASPVRTMSFDDPGDDEDDEPQPQKPPGKASKQQRSNSNNRNNTASQWQAMSELEDWAAKKIELIGAQDTIELINTYAAKGRFSPEEADALMDFVSLHASRTESPTQPTPPSRPFELAARPPQSTRAPSIPAASVRPAQPVVPPPQAKPESKSKAVARPQKAVKVAPPSVQQPAPELPATPTPASASSEPAVEEEPKKRESQNLVLRLIAGVQNAGAGVKWGKHDG